MDRDAHHIGRLDIEAVVADLDMAMALRPRLEALGWRKMPEVLERVCQALVPKDLHLQLPRLDLDLGELRPDHLEDDALAALEAAFTESLSAALLAARHTPSAEARLIGLPEARLGQIESYLASGVMPFLSKGEPFDPLARLLELADQQPEALVAMLRRRSGDRHVLDRLVLQLGETGLQRLLLLLAPADAADILGLLADIAIVHRRERPPELERMTEPVLHHLLWVASLEFLLRDAGSQFNRRRFLEHLLEREAARTGVSYLALLRLLAAAAATAAQRSPLRSGLPRTLAELLGELQPVVVKAAPPPPAEAALAALQRLAEANAGDPGAMEALFGPLTRTVFTALLRRLAAGQASAILADLDELAALAEAFPGVAVERVLWAATLAYLADGKRKVFRRKTWWRSIMGGLVRHSGLSPTAIAHILRRAGVSSRLAELLTAVAGIRSGAATAGGSSVFIELLLARPDDRPGIALLLAEASADTLRELLERLRPAQAAAILARLDRLAAGQPPQVERLALRLTVAHLAGLGGAVFDLPAWERRLRVEMNGVATNAPPPGGEGLGWGAQSQAEDAETTGFSWRASPASPTLDPSPQGGGKVNLAPMAADPHALIDGFLRHGRPSRGGAALPAIAVSEPDWLAARIRLVARAAPDQGAALARRLLDWLLPQELWVLLRPGEPSPGGGLASLLPRLVTLLGLARPPDTRPPAPTEREGAPKQALFDPDRVLAWLDGADVGAAETAELARQFAAMADAHHPALRDYLAANRSRPAVRAGWAARLPADTLGRLVDLLAPPGLHGLVESVRLIEAAWRSTAPFGARRAEPRLLWASLLDQIATPRPVDLTRVLDGLMTSLAGDDAAQRARVVARTARLARDGGHVSIRTALRRLRPTATGRRAIAPPPPAAARSNRTAEAKSVAEPGQALFIGNAGLVLFNPFLPTFFTRLGLLAEGQQRDGIADVSRAVHLLQYLVDGRLNAPEPELVHNKLLCGHPCAIPVAPALAAEPAELALCDELIGAVIANWPVLGGTSPAGLRETFLQRDGRLRHADGKWLLQVQRQTLDVLIDQVPWSFAIVYHHWMREPIHVTW